MSDPDHHHTPEEERRIREAALDETLAVKAMETTSEGEQLSVKIAYCNQCGVALGAVT